jgi:hypothetical protein
LFIALVALLFLFYNPLLAALERGLLEAAAAL